MLPNLTPEERVALGELVARVLDAQAPAEGRGGATGSGSAQSKQVGALLRTASRLSMLHLGELGLEEEADSEYGFAVCSFDELELTDYVGSGAFGQVMRGVYKGQDVAVKRMMGETYEDDEFQAFLKEVSLLAALDHPGVLKFYAASVAYPNVCIVTEYVGGGDLEHKLHETFEVIDSVQIVTDVAGAMAYLHSKRIIHRDLKPANILLTNDGHAKVADYGLAKVREQTYAETRCGSPIYVAVEVVRGEPYTEKADVYSFGVLMWEVFERDEPFNEREYGSLMDLIRDIVYNSARPGPISPRVSPALQQLMYACLDHDVDARPSFEEAYAILRYL